MAAPTVALRFRDTTAGIDTITEHEALRDTYGYVWWGWWKKAFEAIEPSEVAAYFEARKTTDLLLVNRRKKKAFEARCKAFATELDEDERVRVPEYYRDVQETIVGYFALTAIEEVEYDEALGEALGEQTFLWLNRPVPEDGTSHVAAEATAPGRSCLLHLSDLHFGTDYGFRVQGVRGKVGDQRKTLSECLVADLERIGCKDDIAAVLVTGDFITQGKWTNEVRDAVLKEFEALRKALGLDKDQIVAVPGNHDIVRYPEGMVKVEEIVEWAVKAQSDSGHELPFRTFVNLLTDRDWKDSLHYVRRVRLADADLLLCVLNSCTITATHWTEYGYVGDSGVDAIKQLGREPVTRPTYKLMALHHHLLPVAEFEMPTKDGVTLTLDASRVLRNAQLAGVQLALHGHQHKPKIANYQGMSLTRRYAGGPICVVSNGSTGVRDDRRPIGERNTYGLFRLTEKTCTLYLRELRADGQEAGELFAGDLNIVPALPDGAQP